MKFQDIQQYLAKVRTNLVSLAQKAKQEPEYRRMAISIVVLVAAVTLLAPWLGALIVFAGTWYLTY